MADRTKKPDPSLLKRIEELESLLQRQRRRRLENTATRLKEETKQIPVLRDIVTGQSIATENNQLYQERKRFDEKQIEDAMSIIDKYTRSDLEELVKLLKHNIIDELKTELMKELRPVKKEGN